MLELQAEIQQQKARGAVLLKRLQAASLPGAENSTDVAVEVGYRTDHQARLAATMTAAILRTVNHATGEVHLDQIKHITKRPAFCPYGAPLLAIRKNDEAKIVQACCNHWNCPVCGRRLANEVRRRVIHGAETLSAEGHALYFWTLTCRGRDLDMDTADDNYYAWTNKALARLRAQAVRENRLWIYVQVTERQQRGAAHSHFIHTYCPDDAVPTTNRRGKARLASKSFLAAVVAAGLGVECEISRVESPGRVASYISGYLKKHLTVDTWPPKWKRVRWSRDWPDLPEEHVDFAQTLNRQSDWDKADRERTTFYASTEEMYQVAKRHMIHVALAD